MKTHFTSSLPWANTHHHLTYTFFSHASTHKVRVHVPSIRGSSFLCKERAYLTYTICLRGKVNDYFKGLLSSAKNEEKLIRTKIIFGAWIYEKAPGFQPESDIIAPQSTQLQHADRQSKWNLLIFASFLGYWNVLRLEFFSSACQSRSIGNGCPPDYVKDFNRHRRMLFHFIDVPMEAGGGTTMYLLQIWRLK